LLHLGCASAWEMFASGFYEIKRLFAREAFRAMFSFGGTLSGKGGGGLSTAISNAREFTALTRDLLRAGGQASTRAVA
jgi:hypothetical protein